VSGAPEKRELRLGVTPLTDCAPIAVAYERGLFADEGLRVEISREPSWANIRDKVATGALDAAHMLAPMPIAATFGAGPLQQPMGTALALGLGGNAVTVSLDLWRRMEKLDPVALFAPASCARALARVVAERRAAGAPPLRLAMVFPFSMHAYELRCWLASAGVVPDRDLTLLVVPPPRMVAELEAGSIDGFCVGEPWNSVAVRRGSGVVVVTGHDLWNHAPEKVLGVSRSWAERHPATHLALLRALLRAARWCDEPEHRPELARLLTEGGYVAAPLEALLPSLCGELLVGPGRFARRIEHFHVFHRFAAGFPWRSHAAWILAQMLRWGQLEKALDVRAAAAEVYWTDLHREAAAQLGIARPAVDEKVEGEHAAPWLLAGRGGSIELGADRLLDVVRFDPRRVADYLRACTVHALRVPLDELEAAQRPCD
jgi:nitrate/nitrite transport system substrate-binding protein